MAAHPFHRSPLRTRGFLLGGVAVMLCILGSTLPAEGQQGGRWQPDDRVRLTAFHLVTAIARDERRLYAVTPEGLQVFDVFSRRWELPSTEEDGFPAAEDPASIAFLPNERTLWIGTLTGRLFTYHVDLRQWRQETSLSVGPILRLVPFRDRLDDGFYLRSPSGWFRLSRFSLMAEPIPSGALPPEVRLQELPPEERLARLDPAFAATRGTLLMDEGARRWPMTDVVQGEGEGRYWIATAGNNIYHYDSRFGRAEPYRFGLLAHGAEALARDGRWIWFGGDGRSPRQGITRGEDELQEWRYYENPVTGAPRSRVLHILPLEDETWFGTDDGAYRLGRDDRWSRPGGASMDVAVRRLAATDDGSLWAATRRGLVQLRGPRVRDMEPASPQAGMLLLSGSSVTALESSGDTLWVAGDFGMSRFLSDGRELPWPAGGAPPPISPVVDIAIVGGRAWAATREGLWRFERDGWQGPFREVAQGGVHQIMRLRAEGAVLWVGGTGGAARRSESGEWSYLLVGPDILRGPVVDILPVGERVYLGMPDGVMRIDWKRGF